MPQHDDGTLTKHRHRYQGCFGNHQPKNYYNALGSDLPHYNEDIYAKTNVPGI